MFDLEGATQQQMSELKLWLFRESVRIEMAKQELEEIKKGFEKEKKNIVRQLEEQHDRQVFQEKQLNRQKELFEKQWKVLQRGFHVLHADRQKLERDRRRGIKNRPIRAMVVGIPNVGKSTFINSFAGKACARTGNQPGVTKGKQWIRLNKNVELLDTPGILWPKFDDPQVGCRLAMIGAVKDELVNIDELSLELIKYLVEAYPGVLSGRYQVDETGSPGQTLEKIAEIRKCLQKGGELDCGKAAVLLMDEFRSGKLGRITLE